MPPPGYQLYFIAIVPPPPVYEEAQALKNYFKEKYKSKASLNSPPHITLHMPFQWKESKEEKLQEELLSFISHQNSFTIQLRDFDWFEPRVIFINVMPSEALTLFQQRLARHCKVNLNLFNAQYQDMPYQPHLTLAFRDLKKNEFAKAKEEFSIRKFAHEITTDKISLLKHDGKKWNVITEFPLASA